MPVSEGFLSMISWIPMTKMAPLLSKYFDMFRLKNVKKTQKNASHSCIFEKKAVILCPICKVCLPNRKSKK